jgi:hypothetical protein
MPFRYFRGFNNGFVNNSCVALGEGYGAGVYSSDCDLDKSWTVNHNRVYTVDGNTKVSPRCVRAQLRAVLLRDVFWNCHDCRCKCWAPLGCFHLHVFMLLCSCICLIPFFTFTYCCLPFQPCGKDWVDWVKENKTRDVGTTVSKFPTDEELMGWAEALLGYSAGV